MTVPGGRRVAITGLGVVTACGPGLDDLWAALVTGADGPPAEGLGWFDPRTWMGRAEVRRSSGYVHHAVAAAAMALDDAGSPPLPVARTGVWIGHTHGPSDRIEAEDRRLVADGPAAVAPFLTVLSAESAPAAAIAAQLGTRGPARMSGGGCASGVMAVGDGADAVGLGRCDVALAGATAGELAEVLHTAYRNVRVLSPTGVVRPFDARRDGFVYRPSAAVVVIEPLDDAVARGARVYAEVLGTGATNDGADPVKATGVGARECVRAALDEAGLEAAAVAHVNAHGSGTRANDQIEAVTGHSLGAAGAVEVVAACLSLHHGLLPPAVRELEPDPDIVATGIDVVHGEARPWTPGPVLSCSYGLGGQNGAALLGPPPATT